MSTLNMAGFLTGSILSVAGRCFNVIHFSKFFLKTDNCKLITFFCCFHAFPSTTSKTT